MKKNKLYMVIALLSIIPVVTYAKSPSDIKKGEQFLLSQNANYIPCYKEQSDMTSILFRWCPVGFPWTATNESRTSCYATSEDCAAAEMPQSWCIKCGEAD